ncbi:MAG: autotransporter outer membrane beta-barrel domain-containing protein [Elusimicrobia bacterium]|nr:autotransporter outer membrane beta-barrel domain-containing protein [Elusimicrobiota bacterium]
MKKYLILFITFIFIFAAARGGAQTVAQLGSWQDFYDFTHAAADNNAEFLNDINYAPLTPVNYAPYISVDTDINGKGFTLNGNGVTNPAFYPYVSGAIADHSVANNINLSVSNMTVTGFNRGVFLMNAEFFTGEPAVYSGTLTIGPGMIFDGNKRTDDGGGVLWNEFYVTVADGTIFRNNGSIFGGAIYNKDTIIFGDNVLFDNNVSNGYGGGAIGIGIGNRDNPQTIFGTGATFTNNSATGSYAVGGAIINEDVYLEIGEDSYFYNNTAGWHGGAIAQHLANTVDHQPVTIIGGGATFDTNTATLYYGGAIYNENGFLTVYGTDSAGKATLFQNNKASYGGALMTYTTTSALPASSFIGAGAQFLNNTATTAGGAAFNWDGTLTLDTAAGLTTLFQGNTDSSGKNDIYLYYGGNGTPTLNITGTGTVDFYDGFRSNAAGGLIPLINKTSSGEMILESGSVNNNYIGTFTQSAGTTSVYAANFFTGTDNINNSVLHFYTPNAANVLNVNGGTIDLRNSPAGAWAGTYDTLTVNTWNATNAKLYINTYLDGNGTNTDKLVVNGGPSSGNATLYVTQTGTNDVLTPDGSDGILVVDVTNATAKTENFTLAGGQVDTGALVYKLNHATDLNWYLKTDGTTTNTGNTIANMPALHLTLVKSAMSELRERMGDLWTDDAGCRPSNVWARVYGKRLNVDEKISADMTLFGAQAGVDTRVFTGDSSRAYAGIMAGYMYTGDIRVKQNNGIDGSGTGTTPSAGAYGVWFNEEGYFADLTAQYFWAQTNMRNISAAGQVIDYDADRDLWSAGLEGGKSIPVSSFVLTPKAQVLFARGAPASHTTNMADNVYYGSTQSLTAALRLQAAYLKHGANSTWQPFAELGVYNEFLGTTDITFAGVGMKSDVGGAGFEAALGTNVRLSGSSSLFGDVSFEKGAAYQAFAANLGVRLGFGGRNCEKCRYNRQDKNSPALQPAPAVCAAPRKREPDTAAVPPPQVVKTEPAVVQAPVEVVPATSAAKTPPKIPVIYFSNDNYGVTPLAGTDIKAAADVIKNSGFKFEVRGYTDANGPGWYNNNLSKLRAYEIYKQLIMSGVPPGRLAYKGFGAANPADTGTTPEAYAKNRRVEIFGLP